jgi:hypothetical protein
LGSPATTKYDVSARRIELWSPWGGTGRPSTAADEARLIDHLRALVDARDTPAQHERQHVTSLVTALRNGLTAEQMLQMAPGLRPAELVAAYDALEARRVTAAAAWRAIVDAPDQVTIAEHGPAAAVLLPVIVIHLGSLQLRRRTDAPALRATVHSIDDEIIRTVHSTVLLEERLDAGTLSAAQEAQVGEMLYDGFGEGAWSLSTFLAPRIGTLVPARVAALLGEERSDRSRVAS